MQDCNTKPPDPVLDAALATVLDFGVRRATLTEVARRAGLSRMTVYRRYADGTELMRALMSREFGSVVTAAAAEADGVVPAVIGAVERLMEHPLLLRLLELEPEVMLPYLTERLGEFQRGARAALAGWIERAQAEGEIAPGDPAELAATVELACRGLVIATRSLSEGERAAGVRELELMCDGYLRR